MTVSGRPRYPCPWCVWKTGPSITDVSVPLDLCSSEWHTKQLENEVEPEYRFNRQRPPLLDGNALMIYSLPTFHLFQGITQTLYNRAVEPLSQETIHDVNQCLVRLKVRNSV